MSRIFYPALTSKPKAKQVIARLIADRWYTARLDIFWMIRDYGAAKDGGERGGGGPALAGGASG